MIQLIALTSLLLAQAAEPQEAVDPTLVLASPNPYRVVPQDGPQALVIRWSGSRQLNDSHPEALTAWDASHAIASSTLPSLGRSHVRAHQDVAFEGEGSIFSSHLNLTGQDLAQDLVLFNPTGRNLHVRVHALASTTTEEAPYRTGWLSMLYEPSDRATLPDTGFRRGYGPGERTARRILRGEVEGANSLLIPPGAVAILHSAVHPAGQELVTQAEFHTDGPVHAAVLYTDAPLADDRAGRARAEGLLQSSDLVRRSGTPDRGVAGVVAGADGDAVLANNADGTAYVVDGTSLRFYDFLSPRSVGDSADLVSRYTDSAPTNAGSQGADIRIQVPVVNPTQHSRRLRIFFDSPTTENVYGGPSLRNPLAVTVGGQTRSWSLDQAPGTRSATPVVDLVVGPGASQVATLRLINAADNLPPYRIRVETR